MRIGEAIDAWLQVRDWKLAELARRAGVSIGTLSAARIRNSKRSEFLPQIAEGFGISIERFLEGPPRGAQQMRDAYDTERLSELERRLVVLYRELADDERADLLMLAERWRARRNPGPLSAGPFLRSDAPRAGR